MSSVDDTSHNNKESVDDENSHSINNSQAENIQKDVSESNESTNLNSVNDSSTKNIQSNKINENPVDYVMPENSPDHINYAFSAEQQKYDEQIQVGAAAESQEQFGPLSIYNSTKNMQSNKINENPVDYVMPENIQDHINYAFSAEQSFVSINLDEKDKDSINNQKDIPKQVTLSWSSIQVVAKNGSWIESLKNILKRTRNENSKVILNNVNGIVKPGQLLALMGASGSGKTTLLNVLNCRNGTNLKIKGDILVNGVKVNANIMSIISCYIQQDDLFFGTLTVLEHLQFHAMLRMGKNTSSERKRRRVLQVLKEFNLEICKDVKIGIPGRLKGISGGQKRRLSFASEILVEKPLIFCDEPTSGLDSYMAKSIVQCLKKMSESGKTIVCTIHQPSSEVFSLFDSLCLLAEGRQAYFGDRENALTYFSNNLSMSCPQYTNPADFYIDVLGVDVTQEDSKQKIMTYCDIYATSQDKQNLLNNISSVEPVQLSVSSQKNSYKATWIRQVQQLLKRNFLNYFRNYRVIIIDVLMALLTAILGGIIYFHSAEKSDGVCTFNQRTATNISTALFYAITVMVTLSVLSAVMVFPLEIPIFYREHQNMVYRTDAYYLSKLLAEVPVYVILPAIHATTIYFMVEFGCNDKNFAMFLLTIILVANCGYSLGHVLSTISSNVNMAISLAAPILAIQMLFSGFFLKKTGTPVFFTYIKFLSVFNYGYDLLMINQWEKIDRLNCEYLEVAALCKPSGAAILDELKIRPKNKYLYISMLCVLTIGWRLLAFIILSIKSSRKRIELRSCMKSRKKIRDKNKYIVRF